jgi:hypothetical protein
MVILVAHPLRFRKINQYHRYFRNHGIEMHTEAFQGEYEGRKYPEAYATEELAMLRSHTVSPWQGDWYPRLIPEMKIRDFSNIPCLAGFRSLYIGRDTTLQRCLYDKETLQVPYDRPMPCRVRECGCGLLLEELNTQDTSFWNYWRTIAGLPLATDHHRDGEELYQKKRALYWNLMRRYGKS